MDAPKKPCPICKGAVEPPPGNTAFPFCSARCKVLDLGKWLDGSYAVPAVEDDEDPNESALPAVGGRGTLH